MALHSIQDFHGTPATKAQSSRQSRWLMRLLAALSRAISVVQAELRARGAAAELASLDDRMLRDIGVSRSEIRSLVRHRDAGPHGAHWRVRNQLGRSN
jgi:uncharacterized protein YjiS (DUF1127 family)